MANPNKTVQAWRRKNPFAPRAGERTVSPEFSTLVDWMVEQNKAGVTFKTMEEAQAVFDAKESK